MLNVRTGSHRSQWIQWDAQPYKWISQEQFSIGCLIETHEGNWIQQDVKYLLKLTGPIRLRLNIHFSTIWIGCHCHQCAWQTMVDIIYTHMYIISMWPELKIDAKERACEVVPAIKLQNYEQLMTFWQQLHNSRWHQAVLPQHKTEIKHTPFNQLNWVPPWMYELMRLKAKLKLCTWNMCRTLGIMVAVQFRASGVPF